MYPKNTINRSRKEGRPEKTKKLAFGQISLVPYGRPQRTPVLSTKLFNPQNILPLTIMITGVVSKRYVHSDMLHNRISFFYLRKEDL